MHKTVKMLSMRMAVLVMAAAISLAGCSKDEPAADAGNMGVPPSLSSARPQTQTIKLSEKQAIELNIQTVRVSRTNFNYEVTAPGVVEPAPENIYIVSAPVQGRVVSINAHEGERVRAGGVLLELESLEFANLVAEYIQAAAEEKYQISQRERLAVLVEKRISSQRAMEKAEADYTRARAAVRAAHARLLAIGVREEQMNAWGESENDQPRLKIYSQLNGTVTEHLIDLGQSVSAYEKLLTIINPDRVLIRGFVSPEDGIYLSPGAEMTVAAKDFPGKHLHTRIAAINPSLDEVNRSITVNALIASEHGWPVPGQNVHLSIAAQTSEPVLTVPMSALEYEGENPTVFVRLDVHNYEKRFIKVDRITSGDVIVLEGLKGDEEIAVTQVFSLKALGKYSEYAE